MEFERPKIVVSRCLGFGACRYNGEIIHDPFVEKLKKHDTKHVNNIDSMLKQIWPRDYTLNDISIKSLKLY